MLACLQCLANVSAWPCRAACDHLGHNRKEQCLSKNGVCLQQSRNILVGILALSLLYKLL